MQRLADIHGINKDRRGIGGAQFTEKVPTISKVKDEELISLKDCNHLLSCASELACWSTLVIGSDHAVDTRFLSWFQPPVLVGKILKNTEESEEVMRATSSETARVQE